MAKYTLTIKQIVENNIKIFDFNYPFYDYTKKVEFQNLFIDHFYFDEIGFESVGRFKHQLENKLNLIMPYYNKLFETQLLEQRILDNYDVTETFTKDTTASSGSNSTSESKSLYKDAPKTKIDIDKIDIVNSITKDFNESASNGSVNGKEQWTRRMTGNIGVQTDSDAIIKYWDSLRNVTDEIFNELSVLFMGVY